MMIDLNEMQQLAVNAPEVKRVQIIHHVRSIDIAKFLKITSKEEIIPNMDEYSMRCQNLLTNSPIDFLEYMFDEQNDKFFNSKIKTNLKQNCPNFYVNTNPGEATIIFTSLKNEQQNDFVNIANTWGKERNIIFKAINGTLTTTKAAETFANYYINVHSDKHIVFVVANMVSRSFSVPKLVNGIMMVNEPDYAPATQKFNRISTIDWDNLDKISHMYWFNFNNLSIKCPLYMLIYKDLLDNKNKKDVEGNDVKLMLDSINIFEQCADLQKEKKCEKWSETDLFNRINHGIITRDIVKSHVTNNLNHLIIEIGKILNTYNIKTLNIKNIKVGATTQETISAGRSKEPIDRDSCIPPETTSNVLTEETTIQLVLYTLSHEKEDRDFETFIADSCNIFGIALVETLYNELEKLWNNIFVNNIISLEWITDI